MDKVKWPRTIVSTCKHWKSCITSTYWFLHKAKVDGTWDTLHYNLRERKNPSYLDLLLLSCNIWDAARIPQFDHLLFPVSLAVTPQQENQALSHILCPWLISLLPLGDCSKFAHLNLEGGNRYIKSLLII